MLFGSRGVGVERTESGDSAGTGYNRKYIIMMRWGVVKSSDEPNRRSGVGSGIALKSANALVGDRV